MNEHLRDFIASRVIPSPRSIEVRDAKGWRIEDGCAVTIKTTLPQAAALALVKQVFLDNWKVRPKITVCEECAVTAVDAYLLEVSETSCVIDACTLNGLRNAMRSLSQLAEVERGVLTSETCVVPSVLIDDAPASSFRGLHLCWFPETPAWEIEREIRLAAYYKFNYIVLESWGIIKLESHPEFCWEEYSVGKGEIRRLVDLAAGLGVCMIPQVNIFGHATASRSNSGKHVLLERHPEYASLFEPDGWSWCLSNPATRKYLEEILAEVHELFRNPPFFHIGCDEAYNAGSCSLCGQDFPERLKSHLKHFHDFLATRGARSMMWHDMLLCRDDPRWKGYTVSGKPVDWYGGILNTLPKDTVICDWQYGYPLAEGQTEPDWPTMRFFLQQGFDVLACPWLEPRGIMSQGRLAASEHLFGMLQTSWHLCRGSCYMYTVFFNGANAAWNPAFVANQAVTYGEFFNRDVRKITHDMGMTQYEQMGTTQVQIPRVFNP